MKYIRILDSIVQEIIPEYDPTFPDIPITDRYAAEFISQLTPVDESIEVEQNWVQNEDGTFSPPPLPPEPDPDYITESEAIALLFGGTYA